MKLNMNFKFLIAIGITIPDTWIRSAPSGCWWRWVVCAASHSGRIAQCPDHFSSSCACNSGVAVWVVSPQNWALAILFHCYKPAVINQSDFFFPSRRHLVMSGGIFDCHNWQGEFYQHLVGRGQRCSCTNTTHPLTVKNYQVRISIVLRLRTTI